MGHYRYRAVRPDGKLVGPDGCENLDREECENLAASLTGGMVPYQVTRFAAPGPRPAPPKRPRGRPRGRQDYLRVTIYVPLPQHALWARFKERCKAEGVGPSATAMGLIKAWVER